MSNLSELLPSGGGQNVVEFTASGAVSSGKPVILNSDGTVTEVAETSISLNTATTQIGSDQYAAYPATVYDSQNDVFVQIYYRSSILRAIVGTVASNQTVSFGTEVNVASITSLEETRAVYDPVSGKIVVTFRNGGVGSYGYYVVGEVSGTSTTWGTPTAYYSASINSPALGCNEAYGMIYAFYRDTANNNQIQAGTVSGTTVSFSGIGTGGSDAYDAAHVGAYDSTNSAIMFVYRDSGGSSYTRGVAVTYDGSSHSIGSVTTLTTRRIYVSCSASYDPTTGKILVALPDQNASYYGYGLLVTLSGNTISAGTPVVFDSNALSEVLVHPIPSGTTYNHQVVYRRTTNNVLRNISCVSTGSSPSFSGDTLIANGRYLISGAFGGPSDNKVSFTFNRNVYPNSPYYSFAYVRRSAYSVPNLTATNFIGLASAAISDTASGDINVKGGINEAQTGLTIGSDYYVQTDGTLGTTADDPSVKVGQAISATTINMMDLT